MGLYLLAAITLAACTKDAESEATIDMNDSSINLTAKGGSSSDFGYYNAIKTITSDIESGTRPELPLTASEFDYYQSLIGTEFEMPLETVIRITDESILATEIGLKDYMNEHMELKDFTKTKILQIAENGPAFGIERTGDFRALPKLEQNMIVSANAIAQDFATNARSGFQKTDDGWWIAGGVMSAITGAVVGWNYGMHCCGTAGAIVGAVLGAVAGWFVGSAGKE